MTRPLTAVVGAELVKLRGLPAIPGTLLGTMAAAVVVTGTLAAAPVDPVDPVDPVAMVVRAVPFIQVGTVTLGILAVGSEYAGSQIRTSLTCVPDRRRLLAGKGLATLGWLAATAIVAVAAALLTAGTTHAVREAETLATATAPWTLFGAVGYLVLIGLLGHALAVCLRSTIPALVIMLSLVLIVSPLLDGATTAASYLPDQAGAALYQPERQTPVAVGLLVLLGWLAAAATVATVAFHRRDA